MKKQILKKILNNSNLTESESNIDFYNLSDKKRLLNFVDLISSEMLHLFKENKATNQYDLHITKNIINDFLYDMFNEIKITD